MQCLELSDHIINIWSSVTCSCPLSHQASIGLMVATSCLHALHIPSKLLVDDLWPFAAEERTHIVSTLKSIHLWGFRTAHPYRAVAEKWLIRWLKPVSMIVQFHISEFKYCHKQLYLQWYPKENKQNTFTYCSPH